MEKLNIFNTHHTFALTPTVFEIIRQTLVERVKREKTNKMQKLDVYY